MQIKTSYAVGGFFIGMAILTAFIGKKLFLRTVSVLCFFVYLLLLVRLWLTQREQKAKEAKA